MKIKNNILIAALLFVQIILSQTNLDKKISGIISNSKELASGVAVINSRSQVEVISLEGGIFVIPVRIGDVLMFSASNLQPLKHRITEEDLKSGKLIIEMKFLSTELKEVIVNNHSKINAEDLGFIPHGQKKYTPAERKLNAANSTSIDKLLNGLSGRTAMLKKEVEVEKKETLFKKLEYLFDEAYYVERLKIPQQDIKGFQMYCVENTEFAVSLNNKNKTLTMFLMTGLAQKYLTILRNER